MIRLTEGTYSLIWAMNHSGGLVFITLTTFYFQFQLDF